MEYGEEGDEQERGVGTQEETQVKKITGDHRGETRTWPFDVVDTTLDLRLLRPTDLPFNKRVYLPRPLDDRSQVTTQHLRDNLRRTTEEYIESTKYKSTVQSNLTREEKVGLKSLKKRIDEDGIVIYQTDKSGRFSVDTIDNYRDACSVHR